MLDEDDAESVMSDANLFTLRPLARPAASATLDGAFRVHLPYKELKALGLDTGRICRVSVPDSDVSGLGFAWPAVADGSHATPKRIVKVTDILRDTYGLTFQDRVAVTPTQDKLLHAGTVYLTEIADDAVRKRSQPGEIEFWAAHHLGMSPPLHATHQLVD